jgi:sarcosine oxidase subunit gamma
MVEVLRTHPLEAWSEAFADLPDSVGVTVQPFVATVDVRLGAPEAWPGVDLPTVPNTWVPTETGCSDRSGHDASTRHFVPGGRPAPDLAVWLGPDEWLLTSTAEASGELEARVRAAVVPLGGSAADVSAQRIILRLTGERVRDVLARGCSIDLHPRVFGRGSGAQTTLGQAGIVLLALSDAGDDYLVFVRSSFAGYLADWLLDAALEFTSR